jgi:two-component system LytT family sensor kinase
LEMDRKRLILLHVIVWALLVTSSLPRSFFTEISWHISFCYSLIIELGYTLVSAVCFYLSYLWVAPVLIIRRKYVQAFLFAIITFAVTVLVRFVLEFWFFKPVLQFDNYFGRIPGISYYLSNIFYFYIPSYFIYGLLCFFVAHWYNSQQRQQQLQQQRLHAELSFLRSQVNPHFLFNTINDIYSLAYQGSPLTADALLKLSIILRYMLREGSEDPMPLNREVDYIDNVIELQKIASKGNAHINFIKEGFIGEQPVASLLFIAFIENAFKHGVLDDPATAVNIYLCADNSSITFSVKNKISVGMEDATPGIGLKNVRRRLELLYPGHHTLIFSDIDGYFIVELFIKTTL